MNFRNNFSRLAQQLIIENKKDLMILDLIESNDWERPIYFAITIGSSARSFLFLNDYFRLDGMVYKLMPVDYGQKTNDDLGAITTDILYPILMEDQVCVDQLIIDNDINACTYKWGNLNGDIYLDETNMRMTMNFRNNFSRLAQQLIIENKKDSAEKVLDYAMELMPGEKVPLNYFIHPIVQSYYDIGNSGKEKAEILTNDLAKVYGSELKYYFSFPDTKIEGVVTEIQQNLALYNELVQMSSRHQHPKSLDMQKEFQEYYLLALRRFDAL